MSLLRNLSLARGEMLLQPGGDALKIHATPAGLRQLADMVEESFGYHRAEHRVDLTKLERTRVLWKHGWAAGFFCPLGGIADPAQLLGVSIIGMPIVAAPAGQADDIVVSP